MRMHKTPVKRHHISADIPDVCTESKGLSTNTETGYTSGIWTSSAIALCWSMDAPTLRMWITEPLTVSVWKPYMNITKDGNVNFPCK